jgi:hypothetical protein
MSKESRQRTRSRKGVVETPSQHDAYHKTYIERDYTAMTNNIVHFPYQYDPKSRYFFVQNQELLDGRHADLSTLPTEGSSLQKTPKELAREDVEKVKRGTMTKGELRDKYALTASSHRNMKDREKWGKCKVHSEFELFHSFLWHMGPRPVKNYTLDRIDNDNPLYGPGLCRWLDKAGQANNRSSTIYLTDEHGECLPLTVWAARTNQKPDTMRRRRRNGWSDMELIRGKRDVQPNMPHDKFDRDPVPWRGHEELVLVLEKMYRVDSDQNPNRYPNRYVWYEFQLHDQLGILQHRLGRCTGEIDDIVMPPEDLPSMRDYEAQLEPRGDEKRLKELRSKRHRIEELLASIQEEHTEWQAILSQDRYSKEDLEILKFLKTKKGKPKR